MRITPLIAIAFVVALPAGCQRAEATRGTAQIAAKVNGAEIHVHQVKSAGASANAQVLEKIIDRELLVQKALEAGLGKDPLGAQSIDHPRRHLLAHAWIERTSAAASEATPQEIPALYQENEALFAQRPVYRL